MDRLILLFSLLLWAKGYPNDATCPTMCNMKIQISCYNLSQYNLQHRKPCFYAMKYYKLMLIMQDKMCPL